MGLFGDILGSVAGGVIGGFGDKKASRQAEAGAGRAAPQIFFPQPFAVNTLFGDSSSGSFNPSPLFKNRIAGLESAAKRSEDFLNSSSAAGFASRFFDAMNRLEARREEQGFQNLESRLFNQRGINTGTARQIADFRNDISDARLGRFITAERAGHGILNDQLNNLLNINTGLRGLQGSQLNQIGQGIFGSRSMLPIALGGNPAEANAGLFRAQSTQDFFGNLGATVGGGISAGVSGGFGRSSPFGSPGGGFTQNPFANTPNPINPNFASLGF